MEDQRVGTLHVGRSNVARLHGRDPVGCEPGAQRLRGSHRSLPDIESKQRESGEPAPQGENVDLESDRPDHVPIRAGSGVRTCCCGKHVRCDSVTVTDLSKLRGVTMNSQNKNLVIDSDAHVVECAHTWDFMDKSEEKYRPIALEAREEAGVRQQFWLVDGKVRGFRFAVLSDELMAK